MVCAWVQGERGRDGVKGQKGESCVESHTVTDSLCHRRHHHHRRHYRRDHQGVSVVQGVSCTVLYCKMLQHKLNMLTHVMLCSYCKNVCKWYGTCLSLALALCLSAFVLFCFVSWQLSFLVVDSTVSVTINCLTFRWTMRTLKTTTSTRSVSSFSYFFLLTSA